MATDKTPGRTDDQWRWLAHTLTVDRLRELLPETKDLPVSRHLLPNLREGRGRGHGSDSLDGFTVFVPVFTAAGDTAEERAQWRETTRTMVGFYGSTPNYAFIFEQLGRPGTTERLREAQPEPSPQPQPLQEQAR